MLSPRGGPPTPQPATAGDDLRLRRGRRPGREGKGKERKGRERKDGNGLKVREKERHEQRKRERERETERESERERERESVCVRSTSICPALIAFLSHSSRTRTTSGRSPAAPSTRTRLGGPPHDLHLDRTWPFLAFLVFLATRLVQLVKQ